MFLLLLLVPLRLRQGVHIAGSSQWAGACQRCILPQLCSRRWVCETAQVAMAMMRRSVRRRAGFSIDDVAPLESAPSTFVPALFGHAAGDTFVAPHHSARLHAAYAAEGKNLCAFEGDHNSMRPDFWYASATIFLIQALQVEELVGPDVDLNAIAPEDAPHM